MASDISVKLAVDGEASFRSAINAANQQIKALDAELKTAASGFDGFTSAEEKTANRASLLQQSIDTNKQKLDMLGQQAATAREKLSDLDSKLEQAKAEFGENSTEANKAANAYNKQAAAAARLDKDMADTRGKIASMSQELSKLPSRLQQAGQKMQELGSKLQSVGSSISRFGSGMTRYVTTPIVGAFTAAVKVTADFDSAMSQVAAVSGATGASFDALREKAREMGSETKFSATEAAEAFNYMAMAGWKTEDMLSGIEGVLNLAAASGEDLATTSDIVTDALTAFGLGAEDSAHFADVLAAASSNANTNVSMMGESFKSAAPLAGALGYDVEDVAVALGLMANSGIKASNAGTALRNIFTRMAKPTKESGQAMEDLGISITNADGSMRPFMDVLEDLRDSFANLSEDEKAAYAAMLAGQKGMSGLLAIVNASEDDFAALSEAISNADGTAADMAETMQDNLAGQLTILKSQLQDLAISFGDILVPKIRDAVSGIQDAVNKFSELDEGTQETVIKVGLLAAAIGPASKVVGTLTTGIGKVVQAGGNLAAWAGAAGIGLGTVGVVAGTAAAGIYAIYDSIKTTATVGFDKTITDLQGAVDNVAKWEAELESLKAQYDGLVSSGADLTDINNMMADAAMGIKHAKEQLDELRGSSEAVAEVMDQLANHEISLGEAAALLGVDVQTLRNELQVADMDGFAGSMDETADAADGAGEALTELSEEEQAAQEAAEAAAEAYQQLCDDLRGMPEIVSMTGMSVGELADLLTGAGISAQEFASGVSSTRDSIVNNFEKMAEGSKLSAQQILENLQHNNQAQAEWSSNMRTLWAQSFGDEGLGGTVRAFLSYLAQQGPEFATAVADFANGGYETLQAAAAEWYQSGQQAGQDYADGVAMAEYVAQEAGGNLVSGAASGVDGAASDMEAAGEAAAGAAVESFDGVDGTPSGEEIAGEFAAGIDGKSGDLETAGENAAKAAMSGFDGVDGAPSGEALAGEFAAGIDNKAGEVGDAAFAAANAAAEQAKIDTSPVGEYFSQGLAAGIASGRSAVINAAIQVMQAAVNAAKQAAAIQSPSKVMRDEVGKYLTEGIAAGMLDSGALGALEASADELTAALADWFRVDLESAESEVTSQIADWAKAWQEELSETIRIGEHAINMIGWQGGNPDRQIAEYKKLQDALHRQAEGYRKAGLSETSKYIQDLQTQWWGYEEKIKSIEAERDKERLEAEQKRIEQEEKAAEAFQKTWEDALDKFADEYQDAYNDIMKAQEGMQSKLSGYGELFNLTGTTVSLTNLDSQTKAIERYGKALENLKNRGINGSLLDEILGMDVKDATLYGEKLLSMTNREWDNYMGAYQRKQEAAARISESWYAEEIDQLNRDFADKIPEAVAGLEGDLSELGMEAADWITEAFAEKQQEIADSFRDVLQGAISQAAGSMDAEVDLSGVTAKYQAMADTFARETERDQVTTTDLQGLLSSAVNGIGQLMDAHMNVGESTLNWMIDGQTIAAAVLPYLIATARANGTPIVNGT